jgi:cell division topological specificity factor
MTDWFMRVKRKASSAKQAKDRLKLVLIHDRTNLTADTIDKLKVELLEVISRHVAIDRNAVRIRVTHHGREQRLVANIPLLTVHEKIEIE